MNTDVKILVVDDEQPILDIFKKYLTRDRFTVFATDNGYDALDIVSQKEIDCCFLDISMPVMDGKELAKKIHQYDNTIPMVVMTGYPTLDNAIITLKNGVADFLTKPFDMKQICFTIDRLMKERELLGNNILLKEQAQKNEQLLKINQETREKIQDMEVMNLILQELDHVTTSKDFFNKLAQLSGRITTCDQAHLCLSVQDKAGYTIIASYFNGKNESDVDLSLIERYINNKISKDDMPIILRHGNGSDNVMAIPLKIKGNLFGNLVLLKKDPRHSFKEKELYFMNFLSEKASYLIENLALYENIYQNLFSTLYAFVETIEARDPYTKQHSARVSQFAMAIAREIGCPQEDIDKLDVSGYLHDIGKIGTPDSILLKPGRLSDEEFEIIKKHPIIGSNIIAHLGMWVDEQKIIRHHHERFDGNGYPDHLKGENIPFLSRIISVADVYDALTSDRSYRKKMQDDVALNIIKENSGSQFDSNVVDVFLKVYHLNGSNIILEAAAAS
jgi:putative nucleotidyltransferase with HDIG domain